MSVDGLTATPPPRRLAAGYVISCHRWPGQVLADLIDSGALPVAGSRRFRPARDSRIITTAHAINAATSPIYRPPPARPPRLYSASDSPSSGAYDLKVASASRALWPRVQSPRCRCVPMAPVVVPPVSLNIGASTATTPTATEQVNALRWRLPATRAGRWQTTQKRYSTRCGTVKQSMPMQN